MLYPTIAELTKGKFNRYELALATAKCARLITDEYVRQREFAEKSMTGNKDTDKPLMALIDKELRDQKAVKTAINRIYDGEYEIVERPEGYVPEHHEETAEAIAESNEDSRAQAENAEETAESDEEYAEAEEFKAEVEAAIEAEHKAYENN